MTILSESVARNPWYREPWPWLLMAGPFAVIVAGAFTFWLAVHSYDGVVAEDYYKRGLAINQTLQRARTAGQLNLGARFKLDAASGLARVVLTGSALPPKLRLTVVHPTRAVADQIVLLHAGTPGLYVGRMAIPDAGRRVLLLDDVDGTWRLTGETPGGVQSEVVLTSGY